MVKGDCRQVAVSVVAWLSREERQPAMIVSGRRSQAYKRSAFCYRFSS
jgi:hypothetical protein